MGGAVIDTDSLWQDYDEEWDEDDGSRASACRDCGSTDVYWAEVKEQWVLFGINSRKHVCKPALLSTLRRDAFETLD